MHVASFPFVIFRRTIERTVKTIQKMKLLAVVLCVFLAAASADVSHVVKNYLPPQHAASAPQPEYSANVAQSFPLQSSSTHQLEVSAPAHIHNAVASVPTVVQSYSSAASTPVQSYNFAASAPAQSYSAAVSAPSQSYNFGGFSPVQSYNFAASAPALNFAAPAPVQNYAVDVSSPVQSYNFEQSYNTAASAPTQVVNFASSAPVQSSSVVASLPAQNYNFAAASAPAASVSFTPEASGVQESYHENAGIGAAATLQAVTNHEAAATYPKPAHTYSAESGYHYKTQRRVVRRHRRDVSHLSNSGYLPPQHSVASSSVEDGSAGYLPPHNFAASTHYETAPVESQSYYASEPQQYGASGPVGNYESAAVQQFIPSAQYEAAPAAQYESAPTYQLQYYDSGASHVAPAHSYSASEGYRYKTNRRRVYRRHRY